MATKRRKKPAKKTAVAKYKKYSKTVLALARAFAKARHARAAKPKARKAPKKRHHAKKRHHRRDPSWYGASRAHAKAAKKGHRRHGRKRTAAGHLYGYPRRDPMFFPTALTLADPGSYHPMHHGHHHAHHRRHHGGPKKGSAAAKAWGRKMARLRAGK